MGTQYTISAQDRNINLRLRFLLPQRKHAALNVLTAESHDLKLVLGIRCPRVHIHGMKTDLEKAHEIVRRHVLWGEDR